GSQPHRVLSADEGDWDGRIARRQLQALPGYRDQALAQVLTAVGERRQVRDRDPTAHQWALQQSVARQSLGLTLRHDDLLGRRAGRLVPPYGDLAAAHRDLVLRAFDHGPAVHLDELVDQVRGRRTGSGDHRRARPVDIDRRGSQRRDRVLVEVPGDHDPGVHRAERVEQLPRLLGQHREIPGVDPYGPQFGPGDRDRPADALGD